MTDQDDRTTAKMMMLISAQEPVRHDAKLMLAGHGIELAPMQVQAYGLATPPTAV